MVLPATRCLLTPVRASAHLRIVTTTYNTGTSPLKRLNIRSRLYSTPPYYLFPGMAQYPISLKDLAAGLVNSVGDPEDLIIQYPQDCSQEFTKAQLTPILIPRVPVVDAPGTPRGYILPTPDPEKAETTLTLPIPSTNIISFAGQEKLEDSSGPGSEIQVPELYKALKINGVPQAIVNGLCMAVERAVAKDTSAAEFITSVLSALAGRVGNVPYEAWNTKDSHESAPLGTKLQQLASSFPPSLVRAEPRVPTSSPTSGDRGNNHDSRSKAFKITLVRLLSLIVGGNSNPVLDVRLWLQAAQLVALAMDGGIRNNFALTVGPFLLRGGMEFGTGAGGGGGDSGPPGARATAGSFGVPEAPRPPNAIPWGKVAKIASVVALGATAVAPAAVLTPILGLVGFTAAGPAAASVAAAWQSYIGIVEAGSLFSMLTSIGMAGAAAGAGAPILAVVSTTAVAGAGVIGTGLVRESLQDGSGGGNGFRFSVTVTILPLPTANAPCEPRIETPS